MLEVGGETSVSGNRRPSVLQEPPFRLRPCSPSVRLRRPCPDFMLGPPPLSPKFGICGSSCIFLPMPWPTKSRTTEKPFDSTCLCTAAEMSKSLFPALASAIPLRSASSVTFISRIASGLTAPNWKCFCGISVESFHDGAYVNADDVTVVQVHSFRGDAVHYLIVQRRAQASSGIRGIP